MATIEITELYRDRPALRLEVALPERLWAYFRRRQERRILARISRMPEHVMRDIGFDPEQVYDAVPGRWEERHPGHLRVR